MQLQTQNHPGLGRFAPEPTLQEHQLWSRLRADQGETFWSFWNYYEKDLLRLCRRRLRSFSSDAEDVLAEAMLKARDKLPRHIERIRNLRSWLFTLTKNTCIDHLRKRNREEIFFGEPVFLETGAAVPVLRDDSSLRLLAGELSEAIERALHGLPPLLRDTALYRFVREMDYEDIARRLKITPACARKRVQKAREHLRRSLRPFRDDESGRVQTVVY